MGRSMIPPFIAPANCDFSGHTFKSASICEAIMFFNAKTTNAIGGATNAIAIAIDKLAGSWLSATFQRANIIQDRPYTLIRMTANAVGAFSQAHSENRVYRSGKPAGAVFICEVW
jgi:hypothetical protein